MDLKLGDNVLNSIPLPVVVVDQRLIYSEGCENSDSLILSLKCDTSVHGAMETEIATESYMEHPEITEFAHFGNETTVAAVEEISDGERKQEIESVIEEINSADIMIPEHERYIYNARKGRIKRHWSDEWQYICSGSAGAHEHLVNQSVNGTTAHVLHRKPKKRLFAHR